MSKFLAAMIVALFATSALAVPPGSGNWGGGPGNSGPGDKNGQNNQGSGGQTPPGQDKLFDEGPTWLKGFVLAAQKPGGNPESPSDDNQGAGNDPPGGAGGAPPGQTTNPNPAK